MAKRLWWILALLIVLCALVVGALYFFSDPGSRTAIQLEVAKMFVQLMVIGFLGAFVTWSFDEYNRDRDRAAEVNEFRKETLGRLIRITNKVRRVPILIDSAQSARTYAEQMRWLIDARFELSFLRHDIETAGEKFSPSHLDTITNNINTMQRYLDKLIQEFKAENPKLSGMFSSESVVDAIAKLHMLNDLKDGDNKQSKYHAAYVVAYTTARDLMRTEILSAGWGKSKRTR
jgi:hypothetical protein